MDFGIEAVAEEALPFRQGGGLNVPDAGEIRLPVSGARRRGSEVGFAVGRAGRTWSRIVQPLRVRAAGEQRE